jgi:hypothetical protein
MKTTLILVVSVLVRGAMKVMALIRIGCFVEETLVAQFMGKVIAILHSNEVFRFSTPNALC